MQHRVWSKELPLPFGYVLPDLRPPSASSTRCWHCVASCRQLPGTHSPSSPLLSQPCIFPLLPQVDFFSTKNGTGAVWQAIELLIESGVDPELVAALNDTATVGA